MKAVRLLIESRLPEALRDPERRYTAREVGQLLSDLAVDYPDHYDEVNKLLADTGRNASYWQGETIGLSDLRPVFDKQPVLDQMGLELAGLNRDDPEYKEKRESIWHRYNDELQRLTNEAGEQSDNSIAQAILSGSRGKAMQLKMMLTAPGLYSDSQGRTIPMFASHSFSEGLRPAEFLAGTYGARTSVLSTKRATAKGGDLGKMMVQVSTPTIVTTSDCGTDSGIALDVADPSMKGRVLAKSVGDLPAGTMVDRSVLRQLEKQKTVQAVVRSALTCTADRGICQHCVGKLYNQELPKIGQAVGITAAQALSEPITQGGLSCLAAGTYVRMADMSVRKIEEIQPGEWVLGADVNARTFPVKVLNLWDQGLQPVERYTYRQGSTKVTREVVCTADHRILQNKKLYAAIYKKFEGDDFRHPDNYKAVKLPAGVNGKDVAAVLPSSCEGVGSHHEPMAFLLGYILGDGIRWDGSAQPVKISCADKLLITHLNALMEEHGLTAVKRKRSHDYAVVTNTTEGYSKRSAGSGRFVKTATRHPLKKKMHEWGLVDCYAHDKQLPLGILTWDLESVAGVVAGYIASDGCIHHPKVDTCHISFGSCSRLMLEQLVELLGVRLGVYGTGISLTGKAGTNNRVHDFYTYTVSRADQAQKLLEIVSPYIWGVKRERAEKALADLRTVDKQYKEPFYRSKRVDITPVGTAHCWDLSVDHPDELFVLANGLVVKNSKHTGGASTGAKKQYAGFNVISQLVQSPEEFPDRAAVSEVDGSVSQIEEAAQGGFVVTVGDTQHYVPHGYPLLVEQGQQVEAGDQLSEGLVDAGDIVRLRGLGSGRRYFANRLHQVLGDSGFANDRRNVEIFARGAVDHIRVEDDASLPGTLPDDQMSYNWAVGRYNPPASAKRLPTADAVGKFLQAPALHYSIGTRLKPSQVQKLRDSGYDQLVVANDPPGWQPEMQRLRTSTQNNPDWLARMHTSYLKANLQHAAVRGQDTDLKSNIHFAPRLAIGKDFGKVVETTGEF